MSDYITDFFSDCKPRKLAACAEVISGIYPGSMIDWTKTTVTQRLKALRKAVGDLGQADFAREIGVDPESDAYGKAERSGQIGQMVPKIHARWPQVDAGWLFHGFGGNVHSAMKDDLEKAASDLGLVQAGNRRKP